MLPRARPALHAFGHDHSNLFVSEEEPGSGVRYVAVFKSGEPPASYDAAYYQQKMALSSVDFFLHVYIYFLNMIVVLPHPSFQP